MTFDLRLRAYEPGTDTTLGFLPEPLSVEASFVHNNDGALTVKYSRLADCGAIAGRTLNQGLDVEVEVSWGGGWQAVPNGRFLMVNRDVDPTDPARLVTLTFVSWGWLLNKVCDLNTAALAGTKSKYAGKRVFSATRDAGDVVKTMLDEHDARSGPAVPILRDSWDTSHDSGGNAWLRKLGRNADDRTFPAGQPLHAKMDAFVRSGLCDYRTVGRALRMYNQNSASVDRSALVRLAWGDDLTDAPSTESQADRVARLLVKGDGKHKETVMDPSVPEHYGRWEGMLDAAGVKDDDDLEDMGQAELADRNRIKGEYTRTVTTTGTFLPFRDYSFGDWVTAPTADGDAKLRVMQITLIRNEQAGISGNVVLGDRFTAADLALAGRVNAITGGTSGVSGNGSTVQVPLQDNRQPAAPTGLVVTDELKLNEFGEWVALGTFSWSAVTTATDGTGLDIAKYEVLGQEQTTPASLWHSITTTSGNGVSVSKPDFRVGSSWLFTVRAYGVTTTEPGVQSATAAHTFAVDDVPPNGPSTPTVSNWLGSVIIGWNGLDHLGGAMPLDYDHCEVHLSTVSGFTPSSATLKAAFTNRGPSRGGTVSLSGLTYGTTYYVRLVAYDMSGNASVPSAQASGVPQRAVSGDLAQSAIDAIVNASVVATMTSANGLNSVIYRTTDPATISGYTPKAGDTWFKTSGTTIIGQWQHTGSTWSAVTLSHQTISSLDAGVISTGYLAAARVAANSLAVSKLAVVDFTNLWIAPNFADTDPPVSGITPKMDTDAGVPAGAPKGTVGQRGNFRDIYGSEPFDYRPGDAYYVEFWARSDGTATKALGLGVRIADADDTTLTWTLGASTGTTTSQWTTWRKYTGTFQPGGAAGYPTGVKARTWMQANGTNGVDCGGWYVTGVTVRKANTAELIVDGSVTANKLEADLALVNTLYAGPPTGNHTRVSDTGLTGWGPNPDAANAIQPWLLVANAIAGAALQVGFDQNNPVAAITSAGHATFQSVTTDAFRVGGETMDEMLAELPQGRRAYTEGTSPISSIGATETYIIELRATLQPGRTYRIGVENFAVSASSAGTQYRCYLRYALDGATVTTSSTALRADVTGQVEPSGVYINQAPVSGQFRTGSWSTPREIRVIFSVVRYSGSGTFAVWGSAGQPFTLAIDDLGPDVAPTTTARRWTTTWKSSGMYNDGTGGAVTSVKIDGGLTTAFAHALFNSTSVSGETGITVATALSGTLVKAEAYLYFSKVDTDGYSQVNVNPATNTAASTSPTQTGSSTKDVPYPLGGAWVDITGQFTSAARSLMVYIPSYNSSGMNYATLLNTSTHPVQLRLTYYR